MKLDEIIALARSLGSSHHENDEIYELVGAVLALLTPEKPCGYDSSDIVNVDSDGYITIYQNECMRADEVAWAGVEVLRAVERAREQSK